jgi:hypothetical protein
MGEGGAARPVRASSQKMGEPVPFALRANDEITRFILFVFSQCMRAKYRVARRRRSANRAGFRAGTSSAVF